MDGSRCDFTGWRRSWNARESEGHLNSISLCAYSFRRANTFPWNNIAISGITASEGWLAWEAEAAQVMESIAVHHAKCEPQSSQLLRSVASSWIPARAITINSTRVPNIPIFHDACLYDFTTMYVLMSTISSSNH